MKTISMQHSKRSLGIFVLLLTFYLAAAFAAGAQKSYTVTVTSPTSGTPIVKGQMYNLQFKLTNTGMMAISGMDTLMVGVSINGTPVMMGGTMSMNPINPGSSVGFQINNFSYSSFTADNDNSNLCIAVMIPGNANSNSGEGCQPIKLRLSPTAVGNLVSGADVRVYPNPAGDYLRVSTAQPVDGSIRLYDMGGREVGQAAISGTAQTLDTRGYASGLYCYRLTDRQGALLQTGRIAISH